MIPLILSFLVCFLLGALFCALFIPVLKKKKLGQKILEIGPSWHSSKEGTPTMGGLFFLVPTLLFTLVYVLFFSDGKSFLPTLISLLFAVGMGLVGIADDLTKFRHNRNEGLTPFEKMVFQFLLSAAYLYAMTAVHRIDTELSFFALPFTLDLGFFYYVFCLLFLVGMTNSVNLTDGIDGLCTTVTAAVCAFFLIFFTLMRQNNEAIFASCLFGGLLGFLLFNRHPAKVFMGDTGSLFLGGAVVSFSFLLGYELLIMLVGIVYVIEILSVVLQVGSYKIRGKKIFRMAPIHHHFERCGWSENKIVLVALFATLLSSGLAALLYFLV